MATVGKKVGQNSRSHDRSAGFPYLVLVSSGTREINNIKGFNIQSVPLSALREQSQTGTDIVMEEMAICV